MERWETLMPYSLEGFLRPDEVAAVCREMDGVKERLAADSLVAGVNGRSVHSIRGLGVVETVAVYEPEGRVEVTELPGSVHEVLETAFERRLPDIRRAYGSVRRSDCWMYVEYGPDQFITPHIDYPHNESRPERPKVTGINVLLNDDFTGGEFYVETTGARDLWHEGDDGQARVREGANYHSDWFRELPRTRWTARPGSGTALLYGTQLVHGTLPVTSGRVRKVLGFLSA